MRCTRLVFSVFGALTACALFTAGGARADNIGLADFENLSLAPESHWNGTDTTYNNGAGDHNTFRTGGATFNNYHEYYYSSYFGMDMDYWEGCGYSNQSNIGATGAAGEFHSDGLGGCRS